MGDLSAVRARYIEALYDTNRELALGLIEQLLQERVMVSDILFDVVLSGVSSMCDQLVTNETANLAQHFLASRISEEVTDRLLSQFETPPAFRGGVILGCAAGDFHGLGKKIVRGCLRASMYDVTDLGLNVAPERFVEEAETRGASVIGVSSMMLHTARGERGPLGVRRLLRERGLEGKIRLIVGGAPYRFDPNLARTVEADGWAPDALQSVKTVAEQMQEIRP